MKAFYPVDGLPHTAGSVHRAAVFNVLRTPATSVPVGFDARGLPLAAQIAAVRGADT